MTQGGARRGRGNAPSRGACHQTDLEDTHQDSSVSPPHRRRDSGTDGVTPNNPGGRKSKGQSAKPSLRHLSTLADMGAYIQWKESLNYYRVAGWNDMDLLPYAFNSLTGEVGKLALTFGRGLPL